MNSLSTYLKCSVFIKLLMFRNIQQDGINII